MDSKELEAKVKSIVEKYNSYKISNNIVVENIVNDALGLIQSLVQELIRMQKELDSAKNQTKEVTIEKKKK